MKDIINIKSQNGQAVVSSREVAEHFGKRHDKLMSEIKRMYFNLTDEGCAQNGGDPLFMKTEYIHEQNNQKYPMYLMNRDGFSLLAMGFTGAKALEWKLKYIKAFNQMEASLREVPSIAYLNGCANIINTIRRVMQAQDSSPYKIAMQTSLLCNAYGIPLIDGFIEPTYEQILMWGETGS